MADKIAVVMVRGLIGESAEIRDTLRMLGLTRKNHCALLDNTPSISGMVKKVKDLVTWGELAPETLHLLEKKAKEGVVRLGPPRKGFGRKGIKAPFTIGGALGYRGEKINELLMRMI